MKILIKVFALLMLSISTANSVFAVIAYPYPVEIKQPDGSKITVILKGDEFVKWAITEDGYSLMRNSKGIFEYAVMDSKNEMVPSGVKALNQKERSSLDNLFLEKVKKGLVYSKEQVKLMKSISGMYKSESQKAFPTTGTRKLVCILIGFPEKPITFTKQDFNNLFNQVGYSLDDAGGSVYDYYKENSYGQLDLNVTVAGPYVSGNDMAYYGANTGGQGSDGKARELITEAVTKADNDVNYADFDNDNDGKVDGVYVIYAGYGEEAGGGANAIWAHAWSISPQTLDGKTVSRYSCSAELRGNSGTGITRIGVICHEFGHVLGAADYYDTDYSENGSYSGTGNWDLMAGGSWNRNGAYPAHHNAYTKIYDYNWATATTLNNGINITLNNAELNSNSFYRINTTTENEFYLIENRQQHKFDTYIPGHGMIIYHVDENYIFTAGNSINAGSHQGMYPVCANATSNPPTSYGTINSANCSFPGGSSKTQFTDATTPSAKSWAGLNTNRPITSITENTTDKTVSFTFMGGSACTPPTIQATGFSASSITSSSMTLNWTRGNGDNVLVVVKEGATFNIEPVSGITYQTNLTFGQGEQVGNGIYAVYSGSNTSATITGLKPGMEYNIAVYEYNNSSNCYLTPGLLGNAETTCDIISTFPFVEDFESGVLSSCWSEILDANNLHWIFSNGNGFGNPNYPPTSAHSGSKNLVLFYDGSGTKVTKLVMPAFNLSSLTNPVLQYWHIQADAGGDQDELRVYYKTSAAGSWNLLQTFTNNIRTWTFESIALPNPSSDYYIMFEGTYKWGSGVCIDDILVSSGTPSQQATLFTSSDITGNSMTIGWTRGSGDKVLVVAKEGTTYSTAVPQVGKNYVANSIFSSGGVVGTGNRAVYNGSGNSVTITGLNAAKTYYFSIYEYSNSSLCYLTPALSGNVSTLSTDIDDLRTDKSSILSQNYPNPFEQSTTIAYNLDKASKVNITIFNTLGQVVDVLVDEYKSAGEHNAVWTPKGVASGIYFYQLNIDGNKELKRMVKK